MTPRWFVGLLLSLILARTGAAQLPVIAPRGTLSGVVQDSATGAPVGYALIVLTERDQRVFATESGRFTLSGLGAGRTLVRIQQIGFRARTLTLIVDTREGAAPGGPGLVVRLARQPVILPEIVVQGDVCSGVEALAPAADGGSILDEAFKNAERLLTLEKAYPFRGAFQRVTSVLDSGYSRTGGWVDTVRYDSRQFIGYRKGKVLIGPAPGSPREWANYFTTSDLARDEFRKSHCFWYSGRDSLEGFPGYRIGFAPIAKLKTPDWAGSMLLDSTTMTLMLSEARLVNLPAKGSTFASAHCAVYYQPIAPTLVFEFQARCITRRSTKPPQFVAERWLLVDHSFIRKSPAENFPP
jgi:hypothetical protein